MSECISAGAKKILGRLFKHIQADPAFGKKAYVAQLIKGLEVLPVCKLGKAPKGKRKPSMWGLCIKERRKGKPWDPTALKKLVPDYKAGKCPSKEFLEKQGQV